jgi:hypothetical protein
VAAKHRLGVGVGGAGVDDDGQFELGCERELGLEEPPLLVLPFGAVVVVEACLADRDGAVVGQQLAQLADPVCLGRPGLVRVDAERGVDDVAVGERERRP